MPRSASGSPRVAMSQSRLISIRIVQVELALSILKSLCRSRGRKSAIPAGSSRPVDQPRRHVLADTAEHGAEFPTLAPAGWTSISTNQGATEVAEADAVGRVGAVRPARRWSRGRCAVQLVDDVSCSKSFSVRDPARPHRRRCSTTRKSGADHRVVIAEQVQDVAFVEPGGARAERRCEFAAHVVAPGRQCANGGRRTTTLVSPKRQIVRFAEPLGSSTPVKSPSRFGQPIARMRLEAGPVGVLAGAHGRYLTSSRLDSSIARSPFPFVQRGRLPRRTLRNGRLTNGCQHGVAHFAVRRAVSCAP